MDEDTMLSNNFPPTLHTETDKILDLFSMCSCKTSGHELYFGNLNFKSIFLIKNAIG